MQKCQRNNMEEIPEINSYFRVINRGSLFYPNDTTTTFIQYNYAVIGKLIKKNILFFILINQRKLVMHKTLNALADYELFNVDTGNEGHNIEKIQRMFVWRTTKALFCLKENNDITSNKLRKKKKKRKLQTFS